MFRARRAGQALVELALVLPFLLALMLGVIDAGYLFNHQLLLTGAAREGARMGALGGTADEAQAAAVNYLQNSGYAPMPAAGDVTVSLAGGESSVSLNSRVPWLFASSGSPVTLKATVRMRRED